MKNTLSGMKRISNEINKVKTEEDQMTYVEDEKAKNTQSEWQEKRIQDYNNNFKEPMKHY